MAQFTVDELATLDPDSAVRKEFDGRNAVVARVIVRLYVLVAAGWLISSLSDRDGIRTAIAAATLAVAIVVSRLLRRVAAPDRLALRTHFRWLDTAERFVSQYLRASVLTIVLLQYLILMALSLGTKADAPWMMLYPFVTVALRLVPSEYLFVHAAIFLISLLETLVSGSDPALLAGAAANNVFALALSLYFARRARLRFVSLWSISREKAREEVRMRDELRFAREVQVSMLPREIPRLAWLDIAGMSVPATEVGGDYYDFFVLDENRVAIAAADVAGHGLASGMVLSGIRSGLHLLAEEMCRPESVMARMHSMVQQTTRHRMLVTLSVALFDRESRQASITSAAHPPVMLRRASDTTVTTIEIRSLPLGAPLPQTFAKHDVPFAAGDVFLIHTDGIYETFDQSGNPYGLDRLAASLQRHGGAADAAVILDLILADVAEFRGNVTQEDDVTLVVARVIS